ncbi:MAG: MFS transporter [Armatimonadaceae bacterium]
MPKLFSPDLMRERLPALQSSDFRNLWLGQIISAAGSQMQVAALHWQIYVLTESPLALGGIGLVRILPIICFSLLGGMAADSFDRRRTLLITQSLMTLVAVALGVLALTGKTTLVALYICTAVGAAAIAFDNPARQSLVPALVPKENLTNAYALSSTGFQVSTIAGPVLAGLVIAKLGIGWAYFANALSFVAVIAAIFTLRYRQEPRPSEQSANGFSVQALRDGLSFVQNSPILVATMALDFWATFFSSAVALLPIFAKDILKVGPQGFGYLSACPAVGSLVTGVILTVLPPIQRQGRALLISVILYGMATVGFGLSQEFWLSGLFLAATGATDTVSTVLRQTIRQTVTPDHLRGRMVSVSMLFFMGGPQLGELEAGIVAKWYGAVVSVVSGGIACMLIATGLAMRWPWLRQYQLEEPKKA